MATQGGSSRLAQMQMRFQQKQQQEREQRRIEMTGPIKSILESGDSKSVKINVVPGKVRQMFDERRQRSTGIDKSYPLKPIAGRTSSGTTTTTKARTTTTTTVRKQVGSVKQVNGRISSTKNEVKQTSVHTLNGHVLSASEHIISRDDIDNEEMPEFNHDLDNDFNGNGPSLELPEFAKLTLYDDNKNENFGAIGDRNYNGNEINSRTLSSENIKLKPVITRKTAPPQTPPTAARITQTPRSRAQVAVTKSSPTALKPKTNSRSPPGSASSGRSLASRSPKMASSSQKPAPRPAAGPPPENMVNCKICGRNFNTDRIAKHQQICEKTAAKKRKIFDAAKHRVQGTEVEQYVRKATRTTTRPAAKAAPASNAAATKKSDWRRKHEEFIQAIRAAKEMQAHLARGGKVSDLPPPPPSENPDYVECPHCHRRFNESAASRHIPKCATMLHNKPKPGVKPVKKR